MLKHFNLATHLSKESYFLSKYANLLFKMNIVTNKNKKTEDIFSLFGSWQSEKTGDEIINEIYSSRNDQPRDIEL